MARGEIITAKIEKITSGGAGLAKAEGRVIFTELTAPGDLARLRIIEEHRSWARAELAEILEPSPLRVEPPCPLYGICGGCSLQHLSYPAQLAAKEDILADCLSRLGGLRLEETQRPGISIAASAPLEYRNRIQLHSFPGDRRRLGFLKRRLNEIVRVQDCPVAEAGIRKALKEGSILPPPGKDRFTVYSRDNLFLCEGGQSRGKVSILGKDILMDAALFFQSNAAMLETVITDLKALAQSADFRLPMGEIYCGVGTFSAFLGGLFPSVDLIESNKAALALARENTRNMDCQYYGLKDDDWVKNKKSKREWGFAVIDPPREGLSPLTRGYLAEKGPPLLAYVSCDSSTLARDAKALCAGGYTIKNLSLYDFYPQTAHIETLALFKKEEKNE
jgi:23S rRNA (uracil1939-C5)-methyltransferase